jgi:hypothetical protein
MQDWPPVEIEKEIAGDPETLVEECYRLISFPPGSSPDWPRFTSLFVPNAIMTLRLFAGDDAMSIMTLDEYVAWQVTESMKEEGYEERVLKQDWFGFGDVRETRVVFELQYGSAEPIPAFDIFQLVRSEGRWWITSITGEIPKPGVPIPEELLAGGSSH